MKSKVKCFLKRNNKIIVVNYIKRFNISKEDKIDFDKIEFNNFNWIHF